MTIATLLALQRDRIRTDRTVEQDIIVRLKALRPALYLERHLAMSITATAEIPAGDARQLLAHALGAMLDVTTQRVLPAPGEHRELDASKDAS